MAEAPQEIRAEPKQDGPLEAKPKPEQVADTPKINGTADHTNGTAHDDHQQARSDPDAQAMVIASLRAQIQDLFSQVNELNTKLVQSYDRVSDLEDDLHMASANVRTSSLKISQLELERMQHLSALNTGLLVEKSHVTAELTRLMEKATEEAAQRGQAESARHDIEKDLDDLSASLFGQANTMVAEERYARHQSEQKLGNAERALKSAEEAVSMMQQQMQSLQAEKEQAERRSEEALVVMGKGKYKEGREGANLTRTIRLLSSHLPYQEFLLFVAHLRSIHPSSPQPPAMTTLLPLPFLSRLLNEDSEPTVRLDLAPSLNWLSRRSVLSAIHNGQLIIEPISSATLLQDPNALGSNTNASCSLCGTPVFPSSSSNITTTTTTPPLTTMVQSGTNSLSWSTSLFKKPSHSTNYSISSTNSQPPTPTRSTAQGSQVYIFRLASQNSTTSLSRATVPQHADGSSYTQGANPSPSTIYPLCTNNWCLSRLRTTCILWAFVRTGIVERVWEEEVPTLLPATISSPVTAGEKPPVPPRRRGLWGMATALGGRAASWGEGDKGKKTPQALPPPERKPEQRRLPPPLPPPASVKPTPEVILKHPIPPPLPKRSQVRHQPSSTTENPVLEAIGSTGGAAEQPSQSAPPQRPPRRPITPASVPLPESRPQTPPVALTATATAISTTVSTSTPCANTAAASSPVPPPLPRRAAARVTRPLADGGGSRPSTPTVNHLDAPESLPEAKVGEAGTGLEGTATVNSSEASSKVPEQAQEQEQPSMAPTQNDEGSSPGVPNAEQLTIPDPSVAPSSVTIPRPSDGKIPEGEEGKEPKGAEKAGEVNSQGPAITTSTPSPTQGDDDEEAFVDAEATLDPTGDDDATQAVKDGQVGNPNDEKPVDGTIEKMATNVSEPAIDVSSSSPTAREATIVHKEDEDGTTHAKEEEEKAMQGAGSKEATPTGERELVAGAEGEVSTQTTKTDKPTVTVEIKDASSASDGTKENPDDTNKEAYIGDTTWEERTWKELVRLKEDMFWARVGGLKHNFS